MNGTMTAESAPSVSRTLERRQAPTGPKIPPALPHALARGGAAGEEGSGDEDRGEEEGNATEFAAKVHRSGPFRDRGRIGRGGIFGFGDCFAARLLGHSALGSWAQGYRETD